MEKRGAVHDEAEQEDDDGSTYGVGEERGTADSVCQARLGGEDDGRSNQKEEGGKDQVGGGEAVPLCVLQGPEGAVATVIVHKDHEGDGEAAQQVDSEITLGRRDGRDERVRRGYGAGGGAHGRVRRRLRALRGNGKQEI